MILWVHSSEFSVVVSVSLKLEILRHVWCEAPAEYVHFLDRIFPRYTLKYKYLLCKGFKEVLWLFNMCKLLSKFFTVLIFKYF